MGKKLLFLGVFLFLSLAFSAVSFAQMPAPVAQEANAEEMLFMEIPQVQSTGFFATDIEKAPGTTYVITSDNIESSPAGNIGQLIEMNVPGVMIAHGHYQGDYQNTRGIDVGGGQKTLYLYNGESIQQRLNYGFMRGLRSRLYGDLRTIEAVNGPGAIVHGSGAISGFVNMITKNGKDNPGLFADLSYGPVEKLYQVETGYGKSFGDKKDLFVYFGTYDAKGTQHKSDFLFFDSNPGLDPRMEDLKALKTESPCYKVSGLWNHDNFSLDMIYTDLRFQESYPISWWSPSGEGDDWETMLVMHPKYKFELSDTDSIDLVGNFEMVDNAFKSDDLLQPLVVGQSEKHKEAKVIYKTTRLDKHSLAVGALLGNRQFYQAKNLFTRNKNKINGADEGLNMTWQESGLFAEDVVQINDKWTASLGGRYDYVDYRSAPTLDRLPENVGHFSPRVAAAYDLVLNTTLKTSYQHGFRYPDNQAYCNIPLFNDIFEAAGLTERMPWIEPETMDSFELGLHQELPEQKLGIDASLFYNIFKNFIAGHTFVSGDGYFSDEAILAAKTATTYTGDPADGWFGGMANNKDDFKSLGMELMFTWAPVKQVKSTLSYSYSKPLSFNEATNTNLQIASPSRDQWSRFSPHIFKLNVLAMTLEEKLTLNLGIDYFSKIKILNQIGGNGQEIAGVNPWADPRIGVNISGQYAFTKDVGLQLVINNLFGNDVPAANSEMLPWDGNWGSDKTLYYLVMKFKM